ncbi:MAG: hypothetical protein WC139_07220 [Candidatus Kapaibacterium sp.]
MSINYSDSEDQLKNLPPKDQINIDLKAGLQVLRNRLQANANAAQQKENNETAKAEGLDSTSQKQRDIDKAWDEETQLARTFLKILAASLKRVLGCSGSQNAADGLPSCQ